MSTSKLSGKPDEILGVPCDGLASHPGGVAILLVASCYRNRDKLRQQWATRLLRLNLHSTTNLLHVLWLNTNLSLHASLCSAVAVQVEG